MSDRGERLQGIDVMRFIAFTAVVCIHVLPGVADPADWRTALRQISRFAVPFYFIASGYFMSRTLGHEWPVIKKLLIRIVPVYLVWLGIYLALFSDYRGAFGSVHGAMHDLMTGGPVYHLWFLPSLVISLIGFIICRRFGWLLVFFVAVALFIFGLAYGPYRTVFDLRWIAWDTRNGPFYGMMYVATGAFIAAANSSLKISGLKVFGVFRLSWPVAVIIALAGLVLQYAETTMLMVRGKVNVWPDTVIGTYFLGVGAFLIALNLRPSALWEMFAHVGRLNLWVYCIHLVFVRLLFLVLNQYATIPSLITVIGVIGLSVISALMAERLFKHPWLRIFVK